MLKHLILLFLFHFFTAPLFAIENPKESLKEIGLDTKLGEQLDLSLEFTSSGGKKLTLSEFFSEDKPVIIVPAYYDCPRLCGLLLDGVRKLVEEITLNLGKEYTLVTVSFDPKDTIEKALDRQEHFTREWSPDFGDQDKWHFLVGDETQTSSLMQGLGFKFKEDKGEFVHTAAIFILTPDGKISQYFTDIQFSPRDVRLALVEASEGHIGNLIDQAMLFCFRFDPTKGKYTLAAFNFIRLGGALTLVFLLWLFFSLRKKENS